MKDKEEIIVEYGIPMPGSRSGLRKYPFELMKIGDSFFVPTLKSFNSTQASLLRSAADFAKNHKPNARFVTRRTASGVRIWRVEDKTSEE